MFFAHSISLKPGFSQAKAELAGVVFGKS